MRRVKQIPAKHGIGCTNIEDPLNEFFKTLPRNGDEVVDIKYTTDNRGYIYFAMVEYHVDS